MADATDALRTVDLGAIEPARSRHMWTRSSLALTDSLAVVGQWDGTITAVDRESLDPCLLYPYPSPPARQK